MEDDAEVRVARLLKNPDISPQDKKAIQTLLDRTRANGRRAVHTSPLVLDKSAFKRRGPKAEAIRICIDFGTAASKAWATARNELETLPLLIGKAAGADGLAVPSSIFVSADGRIYLGLEAERQHRADLRPGRARFDNLKRMLSEAEVGTELRDFRLKDGIDPTESGLTGGDFLVLYLAWLTDLCECALQEAVAATKGKLAIGANNLRAVARRFAVPCFESADGQSGRARAGWARAVMIDALLRAQVLADTLHGKWQKLTTTSLLPLMKDLYETDVSALRQLMLEDPAIREPVAAGASRFDAALEGSRRRALRELLLIVDAGAGTTDFAMFQVMPSLNTNGARYALLRRSVRMTRIAGNSVDTILRPIALAACGVDAQKVSQDDLTYAQMDLDSRIREVKQLLFAQDSINLELRPHFSGKLDLTTLLSDRTMQRNGKELLAIRKEILTAIFTQDDLNALRMAYDGKACTVHVLCTGGTGSLPIIRALSTGEEKVGGTVFRFALVDKLPGWVDRLPRDIAQRLSQVYPQCAVAIGGSVPQLPEELRDFEIPVIPPERGVRKLPRTQITGT